MKQCQNCKQTKALSEFYFNKNSKAYFANCKICELSRPGKRLNWIKHKYNLSPDDYQSLLDVQNNVCAICKRKPIGQFCVDHCHKHGHVRGLLCKRCNTGLGMFEDDPALITRALEFLSENFEGSSR